MNETLSRLDQIRINEGIERCKSTFVELARKDARRAAALLNDKRLRFPCLYLLHEPILQHRIQGYLNPRSLMALRLTNQIKYEKTAGTDYFSSRQGGGLAVLKWIWETGSIEDVFEDDYEEILDLTASVLVNRYQETEILPRVVELVFRRNRNGSHIHDLVWVLFRIHDPEVLRLIARQLDSSDPKDAALAAELLHMEHTDTPTAGNTGESGYLRWLEENRPYLYFTEESFQFSCKPVFCAVDLERKYLQKAGTIDSKQPISPLESDEIECLTAFRQLNAEEQRLLSGYSQKMGRTNEPAWKDWLHAPVGEQMRLAKAGLEGGK